MEGNYIMWTILIGGIVSAIWALRMWAHDRQERKKKRQEDEEYRKEFFAKRQRTQEERDTVLNKGK